VTITRPLTVPHGSTVTNKRWLLQTEAINERRQSCSWIQNCCCRHGHYMLGGRLYYSTYIRRLDRKAFDFPHDAIDRQ
jgi:hypothetical protein